MLAPLPAVEIARRRRTRNWAVGAALLSLVVLFYIVTIVRIGLAQ
jgi:hypothetical protein